ncbi:MAG: hypothetical protein WKF60_02515 [Ilumatobacter sp.]
MSVDVDVDTATMRINGTAALSVTPWENVPSANEARRVRVQFMPAGFARPGRATNVSDRIGLERLDGNGGATNLNQPSLGSDVETFALQVDGYDVAVVDAGAENTARGRTAADRFAQLSQRHPRSKHT